ncbi:MAG: 8-oxoguanine deaminase [bacterium]|nr:8-oxoguanine deaminase [bacterium]
MLIRNLQAAHTDVTGGRLCIRTDGARISEIAVDLLPLPGDEVVDGSHLIAVPGFVNSHHHFFQALTRCVPAAQQLRLFDWLRFHYPLWGNFDAEMFRAAYRLAMAELLLSGCTTSCDHHYLFPGAVAADLTRLEVECARELGLRFTLLRGSMTLGHARGGLTPDSLIENDADVLRDCERTVGAFHDARPFSMTQVHLAPCTPFNVTPELMRDTAVLARELGVRLHTHLAETADETDYCVARYGKRPLALMEEWNWVGPDVWYAHGIHFNDNEIAQLAATHTGVAHCASSNCRLASGRMRLRKLLQAGVPIGLAVDGCASNDSSNMLAELRMAMLVHRTPDDLEFFTARRVIDLATSGSAALLGRSDIGQLRVGMAADIVLFDGADLAYAGAADPVAALLFCAPTRPHTVIVNGKVVVHNRELLTADEREIASSAREQARRLLSKAN